MSYVDTSNEITKQVENPKTFVTLFSINKKDDNNYSERFKLINSIKLIYNKSLQEKYNITKDPDNDDIYFLGIIPAKVLPCAYIPFNYNIKDDYNNSKIGNNITKLSNKIKDKELYAKIWNEDLNDDNTETQKNILKKSLENLNGGNKKNPSEFIIDTQQFLHNLIVIWTFVILFFKMLLLYYYPFYYNYVIITIIAILLVTAIILKMINTIRN